MASEWIELSNSRATRSRPFFVTVLILSAGSSRTSTVFLDNFSGSRGGTRNQLLPSDIHSLICGISPMITGISQANASIMQLGSESLDEMETIISDAW